VPTRLEARRLSLDRYDPCIGQELLSRVMKVFLSETFCVDACNTPGEAASNVEGTGQE